MAWRVTIKPIRAIHFMQCDWLSVENTIGSPLEASLNNRIKQVQTLNFSSRK